MTLPDSMCRAASKSWTESAIDNAGEVLDVAAVLSSAAIVVDRAAIQRSIAERSTTMNSAPVLNRCQQLAGFLTSAVAVRTLVRTVFVDLLRLTGHHSEQFAEILYQTAPDLRRDPQTIKQWSKLLRRRTELVRTNLPIRPVQRVLWYRADRPTE